MFPHCLHKGNAEKEGRRPFVARTAETRRWSEVVLLFSLKVILCQIKSSSQGVPFAGPSASTDAAARRQVDAAVLAAVEEAKTKATPMVVHVARNKVGRTLGLDRLVAVAGPLPAPTFDAPVGPAHAVVPALRAPGPVVHPHPTAVGLDLEVGRTPLDPPVVAASATGALACPKTPTGRHTRLGPNAKEVAPGPVADVTATLTNNVDSADGLVTTFAVTPATAVVDTVATVAVALALASSAVTKVDAGAPETKAPALATPTGVGPDVGLNAKGAEGLGRHDGRDTRADAGGRLALPAGHTVVAALGHVDATKDGQANAQRPLDLVLLLGALDTTPVTEIAVVVGVNVTAPTALAGALLVRAALAASVVAKAVRPVDRPTAMVVPVPEVPSRVVVDVDEDVQVEVRETCAQEVDLATPAPTSYAWALDPVPVVVVVEGVPEGHAVVVAAMRPTVAWRPDTVDVRLVVVRGLEDAVAATAPDVGHAAGPAGLAQETAPVPVPHGTTAVTPRLACPPVEGVVPRRRDVGEEVADPVRHGPRVRRRPPTRLAAVAEVAVVVVAAGEAVEGQTTRGVAVQAQGRDVDPATDEAGALALAGQDSPIPKGTLRDTNGRVAAPSAEVVAALASTTVPDVLAVAPTFRLVATVATGDVPETATALRRVVVA